MLCGAQLPLPPTGPGLLRGQNEDTGLVSIVPVWAAEPCQLLGRRRRDSEQAGSAERWPAACHTASACSGDGSGRLSAVCALGPSALASFSWKDFIRDITEFPGSVLSTSCFLHPPLACHRFPLYVLGTGTQKAKCPLSMCVCGSPRTKALSPRGPCSDSPRCSLLLAGRCPGTDGKTRGLGGSRRLDWRERVCVDREFSLMLLAVIFPKGCRYEPCVATDTAVFDSRP